VNNTG